MNSIHPPPHLTGRLLLGFYLPERRSASPALTQLLGPAVVPAVVATTVGVTIQVMDAAAVNRLFIKQMSTRRQILTWKPPYETSSGKKLRELMNTIIHQSDYFNAT